MMRPKLTQHEVAERLGLTRQVYANIEAGRTEVSHATAAKLADLWRIPEWWFFDSQDSPPPQSNAKKVARMTPQADRWVNLVPYWGEVPCGSWAMPTSDPADIQISDRIDPSDVIAVRVVGNSMAPLLRHGAVVAIKLTKDATDGIIHLCHNGDGELTLKVTRRTRDGWELHSINPDYPPITAETWSVLGRAISVEEHDPSGLRP